jgi:hypothetical protein
LPPPSFEAIEDLWQAALATALHGTQCSCAGGAHAHVLTANELEEELLDFLVPRYLADKGIVTELLERRNSRHQSFVNWLHTLPKDSADQLISDVEQTLKSLVGLNRA